MKKALVVGINHYDNNSISDLKGSINDANKIAKLLGKHYSCEGIAELNFSCKTLLSSQSEDNKITRKFLQKEIENLFKDDTVDTALLYFSGHGYENCLGGYLVTQDAEQYDEGVSFNDVMIFANNSKIKEIILILDCCMSGNLANIPIPDIKQCTLRKGISILTSSTSDQVSIEINRAGLFTTLLCNALQGGSADILGNVKISHMYEHADRMLGAWEQRPTFKSNMSKLSVIRKTKPKISLAIIKRITEYFQYPKYQLKLNPTFEPTEQPKNEINEAILSDLQKMVSVNLVEPLEDDHMYYAAINSNHCVLTVFGRQYWELINKKLI